jgi:hypothetical protein
MPLLPLHDEAGRQRQASQPEAQVMAKIAQPYKCCVCSKHRSNDANHWWQAWESLGTLLATPWSEEFKDLDGVEHVCGMACLTTQLGRLADLILKRKIEKEKTAREVEQTEQIH